MTGTLLEIWKECCFALNWFGPFPAEINRPFVLQRRQEYGNWFMNHAIMRITTFGLPEITGGRGKVSVHRQVCGQRGWNAIVVLAVSPVNGLVFHSACIGGMNAPRFNDFLAQKKQTLDPGGRAVMFIYDGAPAHRNPAIPAPNTELKMLPSYSPFLNIVEQAISSLKAVTKGEV